jgi:hypothetical protein
MGIAAGPLAWAALLQTNYVLSYVACEQRRTWMLHLAAAAALAIAGLGARAAWSVAPALPGPSSETGEAHVRFMALAGLALCAWFALVIVATEIPALVLHPCTP